MHTNDDTTSRTATIARLNDDARLGLDHRARVLFTSNCLETFRPTPETHVAFVQAELLKAFRHCEFAAESPEHDFASILHRDRKVWMKIDLYEKKFVKNRRQRGAFFGHCGPSCGRSRFCVHHRSPRNWRVRWSTTVERG